MAEEFDTLCLMSSWEQCSSCYSCSLDVGRQYGRVRVLMRGECGELAPYIHDVDTLCLQNVFGEFCFIARHISTGKTLVFVAETFNDALAKVSWLTHFMRLYKSQERSVDITIIVPVRVMRLAWENDWDYKERARSEVAAKIKSLKNIKDVLCSAVRIQMLRSVATNAFYVAEEQVDLLGILAINKKSGTIFHIPRSYFTRSAEVATLKIAQLSLAEDELLNDTLE